MTQKTKTKAQKQIERLKIRLTLDILNENLNYCSTEYTEQQIQEMEEQKKTLEKELKKYE